MFLFRFAPSLVLLLSLFSRVAFSQSEPWLGEPAKAEPWLGGLPKDDTAPRLVSRGPANAGVTSPSGVTIPAGTRILLVLESPLHSTSGTAGSGLYLETLHPVIIDNRVAIPARTQVQGVVERNQRPGHVERTSEFRFRFTTLIFPNNHVTPIEGALVSIPGSPNVRTRDKEGTVGTVDQGEQVVRAGALGAVGGAIIGSVRHIGIGTFAGAGLGAGLGLGGVLLHRGDSIRLGRGSQLEMVLEAPVMLDSEQAAFNSQYVAPSRPAPAIVPPAPEVNQENPRRGRSPCRPTLWGCLPR